MKILIAIDGSPNALRAVEHIVKKRGVTGTTADIHLINVQPSFHGGISTFVNADQLKQLHQEEGEKALAPAQNMLKEQGIAYKHHLFVGEPAEIIGRYANEQGFDEIVIGTRGTNAIANMLLGSVSSKLLHIADMPVLLVK